MAKNKSIKKTKAGQQKESKSNNVTRILYGISCLVVIVSVVWTFRSRDLILASRIEFINSKSENITCSSDYKNYPRFDQCTPKVCGRCVKDGLVSTEEVEMLLAMLKGVIQHGGSFGGASIVDLHSGAMSKGDKFVNIYKVLDKSKLNELFSEANLEVYRNVKNRVKEAIASEYGIDIQKLFLTKPTFFSRMTSKEAFTQHDEYWHSHIDKIQYGSFDYTSLLYLSNYGLDFKGGQFVFDDKNITVEPKYGRVSFFTSGSENPHHVERVTDGTRYALTISFTCDPKHAIEDKLWKNAV